MQMTRVYDDGVDIVEEEDRVHTCWKFETDRISRVYLE